VNAAEPGRRAGRPCVATERESGEAADEAVACGERRAALRGLVQVQRKRAKRIVAPVRRALSALASAWLAVGTVQAAPQASFDCGRVRPGSVEETVCSDGGLAALDRRLAEVYAAAQKKAENEKPPVLQAEQRGWIKGRDECWKSADRRGCVERAYTLRIAELQARYRLLPATGPVTFACDGDARSQVVATFFATDPPTLYAERGDSVSLMFLQPSASGSRYQGRNESFWEHHGEARVTWGHGAPEMRCRKLP
jgi:uncharacterized protein